MHYNFNEIEAKWQKYWQKTKPLKPKTIARSQNIMFWICFHTQVERVYMLGIR
ncbi:hypothetical protein JCM19301_970 [Jejuia pallidilutea]|uniref:Uncharacterized protein n=1 Tax=Jejuia pallidilutea TaxID=504487 RepID=A0A090VUL3_9FLAO|nr:hypothetical protein JCM19301_970 [Jejuia pallidilutea]